LETALIGVTLSRMLFRNIFVNISNELLIPAKGLRKRCQLPETKAFLGFTQPKFFKSG